MSGLIDKLFIVWILTFPFYHFSFVGSLSLDNIIALFLLVAWPVWMVTQPEKISAAYLKNIIVSIAIIGLYFLVHTVMLITTSKAIWHSAYTVATDIVYFILPVLYISNRHKIKSVDETIIIITIIGSFSAFLASTGIIHLEVSRFAQSRIDIEGLQKTVGLFGVYGDMAILMSFSVLTVLGTRTNKLLFGKRTKFKAAAIYIFIILGLLGSQSRNILFSLIVALTVFFVIKKFQKKWIDWPKKFYAVFFISFISTVTFITVLWQPLIEVISSLGGSNEAAGTVTARLNQYTFGLSLIKDNLILGAVPDIQEKMSEEISYIHNMWLKELVQGGLIALVSVLVIYIRGMKRMTENLISNPEDFRSHVRLVLLFVMLVSTQFNPAGTAVYWMMLGLIYAHVHSEYLPPGKSRAIISSKENTNDLGIISKRRKSTILN